MKYNEKIKMNTLRNSHQTRVLAEEIIAQGQRTKEVELLTLKPGSRNKHIRIKEIQKKTKHYKMRKITMILL